MTDGWQDSYFGTRMTRGVKAILLATVAVFVVQSVLDGLAGGAATGLLGLSVSGLKRGFLWQIFTYLFVHGSVAHVLLNMLALFFMGPETERAIGTRHFVALYLVSGMLGGLGWLLLSDAPWAVCVGASGAVFGVIAAFAALFPNRPITLLVFYVLPVTMKAWVLAAVLAATELMFLLGSVSGGIAYAAHLAGGVAGYVYTLVVFRGSGLAGLIRFPRRHTDAAARHRRELDRVLDKIASEGMNSLTRRERDVLEEASRRTAGGQ
jgi:membrane associated rhomboid family serine protease